MDKWAKDKLYCSVFICLTQLYDGIDMYRIYYIKNNYTFRHFTLAIFIIAEPMYPHHPSYITHVRSRTQFTSYLPTVYNPQKSSIRVAAY